MLKALIRCLFTEAVPLVSHSKSSMMVSACRCFNHGVFIFSTDLITINWDKHLLITPCRSANNILEFLMDEIYLILPPSAQLNPIAFFQQLLHIRTDILDIIIDLFL